VGAIKTIVTHRETGLLVQPGNFKQLFDALDVMLSDKALAARLGQAARQSVQYQYPVENITRQYLSLFQTTFNPDLRE
jgi:glycosyltransferase involved in cell wall biosynthesis